MTGRADKKKKDSRLERRRRRREENRRKGGHTQGRRSNESKIYRRMVTGPEAKGRQ